MGVGRQGRLRAQIRSFWAIVTSIAVAAIAGCQSQGGDARPALHPLGPSSIAMATQGRLILVDIPAFELVALEDGRPVLRSRVIVGKPATPTPELLSFLYAVQFNPSWTPTPAMVRTEGARPVPPGPHNPLGQILFELDNDRLIFLHDTNDRSLFDRADRGLSHGCVRVQRARALAAWALRQTERDVADMIAAGATRTVPLSAPIPVLLAYNARVPEQVASLARARRGQALLVGCRLSL